MRQWKILTKISNSVPGKKIFGIYRFMPFFFLMGAALEFTMIKWDFRGQVNFYRTYKRRQVDTAASEIVMRHLESEIQVK